MQVCAILACVQATASAELSATALAEDLFALLVYLLKASGQDMLRAMGELDLSMSQWKLLHVLEDSADELSLKRLSESLALSLPAASRAIEGLHQRGLVNRNEDEHDRRMKRVGITAGGRELVRRLAETRLHILEQFASSLTDGERRRLAAALDPVVAREEIAICRPGPPE